MIKYFNKKIIIVLIIIFFVIFVFLYYKKINYGNNIDKNRIDEILNRLENYSTEMDVEIIGNKTCRNYKIYQEVNGKYNFQKIIEGDNLSGLEIKFDGEMLRILNPKLELDKEYIEYNDLMNNSLFLNTFFNDYYNINNVIIIDENDKEIVIVVKENYHFNTYINEKCLYIDKERLLPTKYEVKNNSENKVINIIYNNIEIK